MGSFVSNNWKVHLYISVRELCFKNALSLLINMRSNFREERIIIQKISPTFREEHIIAQIIEQGELSLEKSCGSKQ